MTELGVWIPILLSHNFEILELIFGEKNYSYMTLNRSELIISTKIDADFTTSVSWRSYTS
jgi:hypothetical protein